MKLSGQLNFVAGEIGAVTIEFNGEQYMSVIGNYAVGIGERARQVG